jgi:NADH-ubiquinone oxidoreductase chain 2
MIKFYRYDSTISHVGFILLALTINTIESIQAFIFYLMQYSLSNLNFFFILISAGYYLFYYHGHHNYNLIDQINSPFNKRVQKSNSRNLLKLYIPSLFIKKVSG